jgi:hypothetical protein
MTVARLIEAARKLPPDEMRLLAEALDEELELATDRQFEVALGEGKFDELARSAMEEHQAGRTKPLDEILDHQ